ncbi:hypothetical protein [Paenibacillus pinihumi]|uniref:hypothetical protein n=1 Tax=Paenibacillus pinihumi TaxID=669462 RepID=UPI000A45E50E|nr:hypothetical protein [Paenibacillus pinihumi]
MLEKIGNLLGGLGIFLFLMAGLIAVTLLGIYYVPQILEWMNEQSWGYPINYRIVQ